jgi:hypothetical protein
MFELADKLKDLKEAKKDAEQRVKELNSQIDEVDYALSELMAETETQSFNRAGTMYYLSTTTRASAMAGRKDELFECLKENGYGSLVVETINANSLSAFVKEQISENEDVLPSWLEGLVNVFEKTGVNLRNAAK